MHSALVQARVQVARHTIARVDSLRRLHPNASNKVMAAKPNTMAKVNR
jgi:hypothetical protein